MSGRVDLCVIGAGSGGLSVAAGAVQMGASVVLIEQGKMGGDCLNVGCVPSKSLIAAAGKARAMAGGFGVAAQPAEVDFQAAQAHVRAVIARIAPIDSQARYEGLGCRVIRDTARFVGPDVIEVAGERIAARRFVIATGSRPKIPPIDGIDGVPYLTNETIFDLAERPGHLVIIGGGPIGCELAQAHRRLGAEVTVIDGGRALPKDDPELAAVVLDRLRAEGVRFAPGGQAASVAGGAGAIAVTLKDGSRIEGTHLLVAAGRQSVTDTLDLDRAGVETAENGLSVDRSLRTTNRRIYAVGDVAGLQRFTHVAGYHAGVVIRSLMFALPSRLRDDHIPWATYTDPELAQVGLTEAQAKKVHGHRLTVVRFRYDDNDRAVTAGETDGLVKLMVAGGRPVGATIVGAEAGELIGFWALAIAARLKMSSIAGAVLPYPTLGEINKRAAGAYFSPQLFDNVWVKRVVRLVQAVVP